MKETKKCDESRQLNMKAGHLQKDKVELESYAKAPSISMTLDNRQNARSEYHYGLLEKIISNENLNEAFKRVKSNIMLNELDMELERRGLRFCRYADDCNVYVKSKKSAERVMKSITKFIEKDLKLKVNKEKSKVDRPWKLKYLGYTFYTKKGEMGIRVHQASIRKLKGKLKSIN